jgi:hypothetical protein
MNTIVKSLAGAAAATLAFTTHAAAQVCILGICLGGGDGGGGGGGGGGGVPEAPEINVAQGLAAVAILVCAAMFLRERFLRQR